MTAQVNTWGVMARRARAAESMTVTAIMAGRLPILGAFDQMGEQDDYVFSRDRDRDLSAPLGSCESTDRRERALVSSSAAKGRTVSKRCAHQRLGTVANALENA
jgi:hypothetical protein